MNIARQDYVISKKTGWGWHNRAVSDSVEKMGRRSENEKKERKGGKKLLGLVRIAS